MKFTGRFSRASNVAHNARRDQQHDFSLVAGDIIICEQLSNPRQFSQSRNLRERGTLFVIDQSGQNLCLAISQCKRRGRGTRSHLVGEPPILERHLLDDRADFEAELHRYLILQRNRGFHIQLEPHVEIAD